MKIFLGADHRGYKLKEIIKKELKVGGHEVVDVGAGAYDQGDDYVDYAVSVCEQMSGSDKGILICGSGHGVCLAANRYSHVRAVLGFNLDVVVQGREDEDANMLCLAADWVEEDEASEMVSVFLKTDFSNKERHKRRIKKIEAIKNEK